MNMHRFMVMYSDDYQVTWWQGDKPDKGVNSQSRTGM